MISINSIKTLHSNPNSNSNLHTAVKCGK